MRKKDSQVVSPFMLSESARTKAARKYVGEIDAYTLNCVFLLLLYFFKLMKSSTDDRLLFLISFCFVNNTSSTK